MIKIKPLGLNPGESDINSAQLNDLNKYKTDGYIFHQCFSKGQYRRACRTCSEKRSCAGE